MAISKKLRFEVFKRDGFVCQYCGQHPPKVILEVDHIKPRCKRGTDRIDNLLTACFDCNRGKGGRELKDTAPSVADKMSELLAKKTLMQERTEQLKAYQRLQRSIMVMRDEETLLVSQCYNSFFPKYDLSDTFREDKVKRHLSSIGLEEVIDAMETACKKFCTRKEIALKYFLAICNRKRLGLPYS